MASRAPLTLVVTATVALFATGGLALAGGENLGTTNGLTYVEETTNFGDAPASGQATALCPGDRRVAGGAHGFPSVGIAHLNYSAPSGKRAWTVFAYQGSFDGTFLDTYAICTKARVKRRTTEFGLKRNGVAGGVARCPHGTQVSSGGASLSGAASEAAINSTYPIDGADSDEKPDDGWKARVVNLDGPKKEVVVFALCLKSKLTYRSSTEQVSPADGMWVDQITCPNDTAATSVGARIAGNASQSRLHSLNLADEPAGADPDGAPDDAGFPAGENLSGDTKAFTAFIVCK